MKNLSIAVLSIAIFALFLGCASTKERKEKEDQSVDLDQATTHQVDDSHRKANDNQGTGPLGSSTNPIKCGGAEGASQYFERLRGPQGQKLTFVEQGDQGIGPFGSLIYLYNVQYNTPQGPVDLQLFFDYDFAGFAEPKAPQGFRLR